MIKEKELYKLREELYKKRDASILEKVELITLYRNKGLSLKELLEYVELPKSTYYKCMRNNNRGKKNYSNTYQRNDDSIQYMKISDEEIRQLFFKYIVLYRSDIGYRELREKLNEKEGILISYEKARKIVNQLGTKQERINIAKKYRRSIVSSREAHINKFWEIDIRQVYVDSEDRFLNIALCCDICDQYIVGCQISENIQEIDIRGMLGDAIENERKIINDPQGLVICSRIKTQFLDNEFRSFCNSKGITHKIVNRNEEDVFEAINRIYEELAYWAGIYEDRLDVVKEKLVLQTINHNNNREDPSYSWEKTREVRRQIKLGNSEVLEEISHEEILDSLCEWEERNR